MKRRDWIKWIAVVSVIGFVLALSGCGAGDGTGDGADGSGDGSTQAEQTEQASDLAKLGEDTAAHQIEVLSGAEVGPGNEWSIIGIARSSMTEDPAAQDLYEEYTESLRLQVKRSKGVLDPDQPTANAKAAIAVKLLGEDPSDVEGYDLLAQLEDVKAVKEQGINAQIWALNAANCCGRDLKATDTYLEGIREMQVPDGGIGFDGETGDVDITAMAIQALGPLAEKDKNAADMVAEAREWLASQQSDAGDYGNSESTSQVIIAVAAMGEDPAKAEDFVKDGKNLIDGQMMYRCGDGFSHLQGDEEDGMATEQALCAVDSALLAQQGEKLF